MTLHIVKVTIYVTLENKMHGRFRKPAGVVIITTLSPHATRNYTETTCVHEIE
jgi:hypothetical protein